MEGKVTYDAHVRACQLFNRVTTTVVGVAPDGEEIAVHTSFGMSLAAMGVPVYAQHLKEDFSDGSPIPLKERLEIGAYLRLLADQIEVRGGFFEPDIQTEAE